MPSPPSTLSYSNALLGIPAPQHKSGLDQVQSYLYPGALQPQVRSLVTPGFNPTSLITGAGGFWRADRGLITSGRMASGSPVLSWKDQSGFGNDLTSVSAPPPTYTTSGAFSSGVQFVAASFEYIGNASFSFPATSNCSSFVMASFTSSSINNNRFMALDLASNPGWDYQDPNGFVVIVSGATTAVEFDEDDLGDHVLLTSAPIGYNTAVLMGHTLSDASGSKIISHWINGTAMSPPAGGSDVESDQTGGAATQMYLGTAILTGVPSNAGAGGGNALDGTIGFAGITQRVLTTTDWLNLAQWSDEVFGTHFVIKNSPTRAFLGISYPQHGSGMTQVQSFLYPGALQPAFPGPTPFLALGFNSFRRNVRVIAT